MEDQELQNLWQEYGTRLQRSLKINEYLLENLQAQKARTEINSLLPHRFIGIFIGVVYILVLTGAGWRHLHEPFFSGSLAMIIIITGFAVADYVIQIIIIKQLTYNQSITDMQRQLAILQSSIIRNVRVSLLQLPFYTTFYINYDMLKSGNIYLWIFQFCITGGFVLLTALVYRAISSKNINRGWVRGLLNGSGWKSATKALNFLNDIAEFKTEKN